MPDHLHPENHKMEKRIRYALIIFAAILVVLLIVLFLQYQALRRQQLIDTHQLRSTLFLEHHAPLPTSDATIIRPWMTFDYLNKLFALSPNYLKTQLNISASSYPRLTISGYASAAHLDATTFLIEVEHAVRDYASSSTPSGATSTGASA
jgi:hypothetical protein